MMHENIVTKPGAKRPDANKHALLNEDNTTIRETSMAFVGYAPGRATKLVLGVNVGEHITMGGGIFLKGLFHDYAKGDVRVIVIFAPTGAEKDKEVKFKVDYKLYDVQAKEAVDGFVSRELEDQILNTDAYHVQDVPLKIPEAEVGGKRNIGLKLIRIPVKDGEQPKGDPVVLDVRLRYLAWAVPRPGTGEDIRNM